jgi:O-antigen/teichoic acid export membrane protein
MVEKAIRMVVLLAAARISPPREMGEWNLYSLVFTFAAAFQLAQINGLRREIPLLAPSSVRSPEALVGSATAGSLILPLILLLGAALMKAPAIAIATCTALIGQTVFQASNAALVGAMDLRRAARQQWLSAMLVLLISIVAVSQLGLVGYPIALTVAGLFAGIAIGPAQWSVRGARALIPELAAAGVWPMFVGLVFWLPHSMDRPFIAAYLGQEQLGLYTIAIQVALVAVLVRSALAEQAYPPLARAIRDNFPHVAIMAILHRQLRLTLIAATAVLAGTVLLAWPLVNHFLPAYRPGISAAVLAGVAGMAGVPGHVAGNAFHALRRSSRYLGWQLLSVVICAALFWACMTWVRSLWSLPAAIAIGLGTVGLAMWRDGRRLLATNISDVAHG